MTESLEIERPARQKSRIEVVLDHIKALIAEGRLKLGDRLPTELELAAALGVSRTPVREAMKVLAAAGIVEVRQGHGTFISDGARGSLSQLLLFQIYLKDTTPQKLMEVRMLFERSCAELAAQRRTAEDLTEMRRCIEHLRDLTAAAPGDVDALAEADLDFHRAVYRATHNELVETIANLALNMVAPWIRRTHEHGEADSSVRLHEVMYTLIEARNSGGARECYGVDANMEHFREMLERLEPQDVPGGAGGGAR